MLNIWEFEDKDKTEVGGIKNSAYELLRAGVVRCGGSVKTNIGQAKYHCNAHAALMELNCDINRHVFH